MKKKISVSNVILTVDVSQVFLHEQWQWKAIAKFDNANYWFISSTSEKAIEELGGKMKPVIDAKLARERKEAMAAWK